MSLKSTLRASSILSDLSHWDVVSTPETEAARTALEDAAQLIWTVRGTIQQLQTDIRALCEERARYDTAFLPEEKLRPFFDRFVDFANQASDELAVAHNVLIGFCDLTLSAHHELMLEDFIEKVAATLDQCIKFSDPESRFCYEMNGYRFEISLDWRLSSLRDSLGGLTAPLEAVEAFLEPYDQPPVMSRAERDALTDFGPA